MGGAHLDVAYKAEDAGRELIVVNPRDTSRRCSSAGTPRRRTAPRRRCSAAVRAVEDHADVNAARNILWLGLSLRRQKREAEADAA